jgi:cell wall-associated NlpC family hydrolase
LVASWPAAASTHHRPWFSHPTNAVETPLPADGKIADTTSHQMARPAVVSTPSPEPKSAKEKVGQKIAQQALRYKGTKYHFGGNSKYKGFDCSGLVARVYNDLKFKQVPHMSSALYEKGQPVKLSELRPGDLVFFKNTYRSGISHVGIYAGNNRFIHARNHRYGVTISPLSDPYFQLHYAGARRLY